MNMSVTLGRPEAVLTKDFEKQVRDVHELLDRAEDVKGLWDFLFAVFLKLGRERSFLLNLRTRSGALLDARGFYPDCADLMAVQVLTGQQMPPWQLLAVMMAHMGNHRKNVMVQLQQFVQKRLEADGDNDTVVSWEDTTKWMNTLLERERVAPELLPYNNEHWSPSAKYPTLADAKKAGVVKGKPVGRGKRGRASRPPNIPEPSAETHPFDWVAWKANRGRKEFGLWVKPLLMKTTTVTGFGKRMEAAKLAPAAYSITQMLIGVGADYWNGNLMKALLEEAKTDVATVVDMYRTGELA